MKKLAFWGLILFFALFQFSCEEIGPNIDLGGNGGGGVVTGAQERKILIEEFTGVQCVNCPEGSEVIESLVETYGSQLIPISIHAGFFSNPYPQSNYDFRTNDGDQIDALLGTASAWPAASINRTVFEGADGFIVGKNSWPGYVAQAIAEDPSVEIQLTKNYNSGTRLLEVTADLSFVESTSDPLLVTVIITENNIVDAQITPEGLMPAYVHKHVFRGAMSNPTGDAYTGGTTNAGDTGSQSFSLTLPAEWVESNCEIVALVHSQVDKHILQANTAHIVD